MLKSLFIQVSGYTDLEWQRLGLPGVPPKNMSADEKIATFAFEGNRLLPHVREMQAPAHLDRKI